jgi:hypothetical protein
LQILSSQKGFFYTPVKPLVKIFFNLLTIVLTGTFTNGSVSCFAQGNSPAAYLETRFQKDSIQTTENSFFYNSLSLRNTSGRELNLNLVMEAPCFVNLVSEKNQNITLKPEESTTIPIRFSGNSKNSCISEWTVFSLKLFDPALNLSQSADFHIRPSPSVKWKVQLTQPVVIISDLTKKLVFSFRIENSGNLPDQYKISFANEFAVLNFKSLINLKAGEATVEEINLKLNDAEIKEFQRKEVTVFFENNTGEKKVLTQKFGRIENIFRDNVDAWHRVPVTAELNTVGLLKNDTYHFLRIFGNLSFSKDRALNFNFQTPSIHMNGQTESGALPVVDYFSPHFNISAGLIYEANQFIVFGTGVRVRYKKNVNDWYEVTLNKSNFLNSEQAIIRMGFASKKTFSYSNNTIANLNHDQGNNAVASIHRVEWKKDKYTKLTGEIGLGFENVKNNKTDTSVMGPMISLIGENTQGKFVGSINIQTYSKSFPGVYKGYTHYLHDIRWKFGKYSIGSYLEFGNQQPFIYIDTAFTNSFNYLLKNVSARFSYTGKKFNILLYPGVLLQKQDSLNSINPVMKKMTTSLTYSFLNKWQISISNNVGSITIPTMKSIGSIFSMYNFISVQSRITGIYIRYDVGPYFYRDIRDYAEKGIYRTVLQFAPFLNLPFPKYNLDTRTQLNLAANKPTEDNGIQLSNNVTWQPPLKGLSVGVNTTIDFKNRSNTYINLIIRKPLNVPIYKKHTYKNFKVVLFKDADGDGKKSDSEVFISNANLMLESRLLQTNEVGEIEILNYAGNALHLDLSPINNVIGWIPSGGLKQDWPIMGKGVINIPFKKAKLITGKLFLDKDEKSTDQFDVEGIRITAVGRDGSTYTTLTGSDGSFYLSVVDDEYVVSINEKVFDENFKITDPVRNVDLIHNRRIDLNFVVRQKRRDINIKKQ